MIAAAPGINNKTSLYAMGEIVGGKEKGKSEFENA